MARTLWLDVSKYQEYLDYQELKNNGIEGLILRYSYGMRKDPMLDIHYKGCANAGLNIGGYHWIDPLYDADAQAALFKGLVSVYPAAMIAGDCEQWWANWDKYYKYLNGKLAKGKVPRLGSKRIFSHMNRWFEYMKENLDTPLVCYTSVGFIYEWCLAMIPVYNNHRKWLAQFSSPRYSGYKTWITLSTILPADEKLWMPKEMQRPDVWQWTGDKIFLPGHPSTADINFMYDGDTWLGKIEPPEVTPTLPYRVRYLLQSTSALNVRPSPNASNAPIRVIVKTTPPTPIYCTEEVSGSWVKLYNEEAWVHSNYITK